MTPPRTYYIHDGTGQTDTGISCRARYVRTHGDGGTGGRVVDCAGNKARKSQLETCARKAYAKNIIKYAVYFFLFFFFLHRLLASSAKFLRLSFSRESLGLTDSSIPAALVSRLSLCLYAIVFEAFSGYTFFFFNEPAAIHTSPLLIMRF